MTRLAAGVQAVEAILARRLRWPNLLWGVRDGTVLHFDIHADDIERARALYAPVIGWRLHGAVAALPRSGERKRVYCVEMGRINPFRCT